MWPIRGTLLYNAVHNFPAFYFAVTIETNRLPNTKSCSNMPHEFIWCIKQQQ